MTNHILLSTIGKLSNHDMLLLALGSLSGFSLTFFLFACFYKQQMEARHNSTERMIADAKRIAYSAGYADASKNAAGSLNASRK